MSTRSSVTYARIMNFIFDSISDLRVNGKFDYKTECDIISSIHEAFRTGNKNNPYIRYIDHREKDNNKIEKLLSDDIPLYELCILKKTADIIFNSRNTLLLRHEADIKSLMDLKISDKKIDALRNGMIKLLRKELSKGVIINDILDSLKGRDIDVDSIKGLLSILSDI
jgi:hypothetical protein